MGIAKAGEADAAIVPPTDTGHGDLGHPVVRRGTTERGRHAGSSSKLATQALTTQAKPQTSSLRHRKLRKHITDSEVTGGQLCGFCSHYAGRGRLLPLISCYGRSSEKFRRPSATPSSRKPACLRTPADAALPSSVCAMILVTSGRDQARPQMATADSPTRPRPRYCSTML